MNENEYHFIRGDGGICIIMMQMVIIINNGGGEGQRSTLIGLDTAPPLIRRKNSRLGGVNMLTAQKRKFALALMSGSNQTASAIKAGYSEKSARSKGSQLANDPEVIAFIERKKNEKVEIDEEPAYRRNVYTPTVNPPGKTPPPKPPEVAGTYDDPLQFLMAVMNDLNEETDVRKDAAKAMLPYIHPKKGEAGKKDAKNDAAKKAANKFAVQQPPKLVVNNRGK